MKYCLLFIFLFFSITGFSQPFITTWKTDNPGTSNSTSITIPTTGGGYNYDVDWDDDGTFDEFGITGDVTHDFGAAGTYTIRIQGDFPRIYFNYSGDSEKILSINQWGNIAWTSMERAFQGASNLTSSATDEPDLSNVTNLSFMFSGASSFNGDLSTWNVGNVTNVFGMFDHASTFNGDISTWNMGNVTNTSYMFFGANSFNGDLSNWNMSSVTDISSIFQQANSFNGNISTWNVGNVTNMEGMFISASSFNGDISTWNTSNVTNTSEMFSNANSFNGDLSGWDMSSVTNMLGMFDHASSFNGNVSTWNVSNVTNMSYMFRSASSFNGDLSAWNVSSVTTMEEMFDSANSFNGNVSTWNVGNVMNMGWMFHNANSFNGDLSTWNVGNVMYMYYMFHSASSFNGDLSTWNVSSVIDMEEIFSSASSFDQDLGSWNLSSINNMNNMLNNSGLSIANYDNTLIGWESQGVSALTLGANGLEYCNGETARNSLVSTYGWTITGDAANCISTWTNGSGDGNWSNANNWSTENIPTSLNELTIAMDEMIEIPASYAANCETLNLTNGADLDLKSGSSLTCSGSGVTIDNANSILQGIGAVTGNISHSAGKIAPGASPGILTINGDYDNSGGTLDMEINGTTPGTDYDRLSVEGDVTLNIATSKLNLNFGFNPETGNTFNVVTANNISGTIGASNINFSGGNVSTVSLSYPDASSVKVTVTALLPVELSNFSAIKKGEHIQLEWETQSEINNSHFEVEHSTDGQRFYMIGKIDGAGNSLAKNNYSFLHKNPVAGINYYRLKQMDFDGTHEYSKIISVEMGNGNIPFKFHPNPAGDILFLTLDSPDEIYTVHIFNLHGNLMQQQVLEGENQKYKVDLIGLPSGIYTLEIMAGQQRWQERFVKMLK